ncbi:MAG: sigma-70 family RNA polymerase sigma factor [Deltaproteobacteria bacterium]|nr:sigma-70 family RNA polymerase sigma factor [Deltaproteobacteria bacterium]MBW2382840.1 sigma-70 family RNA polymerase sigma factor [Deltaproteobacteria bacterium]MBW2696530.1 sigma-70 family RNA polymerase sigma factor [Deltaproteobacteria bacterium]
MQGTDPDVELMLAFRAGDDSAFDGLFRHWAGPLLRYLERMVGDTATAEELVQETFFRVHKARARYEPRARFSTWLYRIATNLALNELSRPRRRYIHEEQDEGRLHAAQPRIEDVVELRRMGDTLERELAKLPERQRIALWLSAAEGQSYAEVAQVLETTEKSVKALVHRGRAALVARIGDRGIGPAREPKQPSADGRTREGRS